MTTDDLTTIRVAAKRIAGPDWREYVTSGYIGLLDAQRTFNPAKACFGTHRNRRIIGAMQDQRRNERGRYRKHGKGATHVSDAALQFVAVQPVSEIEQADDLQYCIAGLGEQDRRACELLSEGKTRREVARELGITPQTLWNWITQRIRPALEAQPC